MAKYKRILLATDLNRSSENLHQKAKEFAKLFKAHLTLAYVLEPIYAYENPEIDKIEGSIIREVKKEMSQLGGKLDVVKADQHVEIGSVKNQILKLADELDIDLIMVGSHGRHGLSRLLGSSASAIVHGAQCDVFVVRTHQ